MFIVADSDHVCFECEIRSIQLKKMFCFVTHLLEEAYLASEERKY